jgi:hypothetical protein
MLCGRGSGRFIGLQCCAERRRRDGEQIKQVSGGRKGGGERRRGKGGRDEGGRIVKGWREGGRGDAEIEIKQVRGGRKRGGRVEKKKREETREEMRRGEEREERNAIGSRRGKVEEKREK